MRAGIKSSNYCSNDPRAACQGKQQFDNYTEAATVAHRSGRKWKESGNSRRRVYRCGHCHKFHIGFGTVKSPVRRPMINYDDAIGDE